MIVSVGGEFGIDCLLHILFGVLSARVGSEQEEEVCGCLRD
jgi:hypothetical protein